MYYSKSTGGFYDEGFHGARTLRVIAPGWAWPEIDVPDPEWVAADHPEGTPVQTITILDPEAIADTIEIDNPDCKIPADAVEITAEAHAELLAGQSSGKQIVADLDGRPMLVDPPPPTREAIIAGFTAAIQQRLDDFARQRSYDSILSACTYAASAVPKFQAEGAYCVSARDATWAAADTLLAEHTAAGTTPTLDEVLTAMPVLVWPA
ncbi:MAG: hypothetical protein V4500_07665 [Pseudomonadota bacterium]